MLNIVNRYQKYYKRTRPVQPMQCFNRHLPRTHPCAHVYVAHKPRNSSNLVDLAIIMSKFGLSKIRVEIEAPWNSIKIAHLVTWL